MINDPTALFALAICIGILGLVVLILPLLILFWSQMEPQLIGFVNGGASDSDDDYTSHAVLPQLMKSFGDLTDRRSSGTGKKAPRAKAKPAARRKPATTSRSKATARTKTAAKSKPKPAAKSKSRTAAAAKSKPKSGTTTAKKAKAKPKPKSSAAQRRTPAGAKRDAVLGVVYSKKPKEIDDLKEIKGVAKVIEGKLHKAGIYTFRQIVEWDAAAVDALSEQLSFKGRIRNDGWQKQCAKFHKAKYGEKIG